MPHAHVIIFSPFFQNHPLSSTKNVSRAPSLKEKRKDTVNFSGNSKRLPKKLHDGNPL
jgi:hypothetical protein